MSKVLAAMSGGVDSSVTAALLLSQGYEVVGVNMLLSGVADAAGAEAACNNLGIGFLAADLREKFDREVVSPFVRSYLEGLTPNPCIFCNRAMKFGALFELADELHCDYIATGHYVRKLGGPGRWSLHVAADEGKDQSYVLYALTQAQLNRLLFPLGDLTKDHVRQIARNLGMEAADKPESQDICFIPDGNHAAFIEGYTGKALEPGDFIDKDGHLLGRHRGLAVYTVGQRRGLNLPMGDRVYVTGKNPQNNTVSVGLEESLLTDTVSICNVVFSEGTVPRESLSVTTRLRYRQKAQKALLTAEGDRALLVFDKPQRAPAPGQAAVFYIGDRLIGGGTITNC